MEQNLHSENTFVETTIVVNRVAKVVKGGRNFSFNALVVVGDRKGSVGHGLGKAREVADAVTKGTEIAKRSMQKFPIVKGTIPHKIIGRFGAGKVVMKPASPGTGIIAGGAARLVLEAMGIRDILCKSLGSSNPVNVLRATFNGLENLYDATRMSKKRGISVGRLLRLPFKEEV